MVSVPLLCLYDSRFAADVNRLVFFQAKLANDVAVGIPDLAMLAACINHPGDLSEATGNASRTIIVERGILNGETNHKLHAIFSLLARAY
jgi:hypothetical protein